MSERLVDVERDDLRDGDAVIQTVRYRGQWSSGRFAGPVDAEVAATYQRVERDPELPTTPGAVIWAEVHGQDPQEPHAYELRMIGAGYRRWVLAGGVAYGADQIAHVYAVLRDPGSW